MEHAVIAVLPAVAVVSLVAGFASAGPILLDAVRGHGQTMGFMNVVWPVNALYPGTTDVGHAPPDTRSVAA